MSGSSTVDADAQETLRRGDMERKAGWFKAIRRESTLEHPGRCCPGALTLRLGLWRSSLSLSLADASHCKSRRPQHFARDAPNASCCHSSIWLQQAAAGLQAQAPQGTFATSTNKHRATALNALYGVCAWAGHVQHEWTKTPEADLNNAGVPFKAVRSSALPWLYTASAH